MDEEIIDKFDNIELNDSLFVGSLSINLIRLLIDLRYLGFFPYK